MRQGQQNRRGRGRGRKPQNPLARNYESNGPDVKIRGTAAHIAEKYMSLARDALASGDMVTAESYLQHAEHYNRIIMAAQSQMGPQHGGHQSEGPNGGYRPQASRWNSEGDEGDDDGVEAGGGDFRQGADFRQGEFRQGESRQGESRQGGDFRQGESRQGGRDERRHGGNGREGASGQNGSDQPEPQAGDDTSSDQPT
ncbi:MAG: DUF4167 domain-containing protein [Methyloceanibacter sp.]